jgi:hypothetical protein
MGQKSLLKAPFQTHGHLRNHWQSPQNQNAMRHHFVKPQHHCCAVIADSQFAKTQVGKVDSFDGAKKFPEHKRRYILGDTQR